MGEKIISQRTLPPQLWKQRKNSKHSHKTSCYWLNIIGKLHTSHGKFHSEWNSKELLPRRHLGHLHKKLHNSLRKLHKVLLGISLDFHAGDAYKLLPGEIIQWMKIQRVTQKASVKLDNLHSGWKIGSYPKVARKELAQWMKTGWKWMKPHCLSTLDLPLPIHPLSNFCIISKCFYTSLNLAFEEDGFKNKKYKLIKWESASWRRGNLSVAMSSELSQCNIHSFSSVASLLHLPPIEYLIHCFSFVANLLPLPWKGPSYRTQRPLGCQVPTPY